MYWSYYYKMFPHVCSFITNPIYTIQKDHFTWQNDVTGIILIENCDDLNCANKIINICKYHMSKITESLSSGYFSEVYFEKTFDDRGFGFHGIHQLPAYIYPVVANDDMGDHTKMFDSEKYAKVTFVKR